MTIEEMCGVEESTLSDIASEMIDTLYRTDKYFGHGMSQDDVRFAFYGMVVISVDETWDHIKPKGETNDQQQYPA